MSKTKKPAKKPAKNKAANAGKRKATKRKKSPPAKAGRKASSSTKKQGGLLSKLFGKKETPAKKPTKKKDELITVNLKRHKDKNGGHHHVILEDFEDKHVSIGLTTKNTKGKNSNSTNFKLEASPLNDGKKSYMRRQGTVDYTKNYGKEVTSGVMTSKDFSKAKEYGAKAKQKYLEKKAQKKQ